MCYQVTFSLVLLIFSVSQGSPELCLIESIPDHTTLQIFSHHSSPISLLPVFVWPLLNYLQNFTFQGSILLPHLKFEPWKAEIILHVIFFSSLWICWCLSLVVLCLDWLYSAQLNKNIVSICYVVKNGVSEREKNKIPALMKIND